VINHITDLISILKSQIRQFWREWLRGRRNRHLTGYIIEKRWLRIPMEQPIMDRSDIPAESHSPTGSRVNPRRVWQPHELGAILHHQLSAPLQVELGELRLGIAGPGTGEAGISLMSFGELLHHSSPPVQVLEMMKDVAKCSLSIPNALLPAEVATVLYFCSILIAMARCGQSITTLGRDSIINGGEWILAQAWVEPSLKALCQETLNQLKSPPADCGSTPHDQN
jgi:hypothetical protein